MYFSQLFALVLLFALGAPAYAGRLVLKNGDRITGAIVESDGKSVTIKTEYAGNVTVPMSAVTSIESDDPVYVTLPGGATAGGPIKTIAGALVVGGPNGLPMTLPLTRVTALRSKASQDAFERRRDAGPLDLWSGSLDAGLSLARGNSDATTFTMGFNAVRAMPNDKTTLYATSVYTRSRTDGASVTAANTVRAGGRYDVNVSDRVFAFGSLDLERDELRSLDLRAVLGSGFGWHASRTERTTFDVFGGATMNREQFSSQSDRVSAEALVGQELTRKLSNRAKLRQRVAFYPNLNEGGAFRLNVDTSAETSLNRWLGFHVTVSDRYVNNATAPAENHDVLVTTGVRLTFAH
jgi:putative salt-induced outer membrane protein